MDEEFKIKLLVLYPNFDKVTGPYLRKDGRKHICLNNSKLSNGNSNKTKTISYPKALVEVRDGRLLLPNETVDHDDQDFTNDRLDNLIIRDRVDHIKLDVKRRAEVQAQCVNCKTNFQLTRYQLNSNKAGPFCSRRCSGLYGTEVQYKNKTKLNRVSIDADYFTMKTKSL